MKQRYAHYNTKRRIQKVAEIDFAGMALLAGKVVYGGNPEHNKNPGDFGLTPPSDPRLGKSLCDVVGVFSRAVAVDLLRQGLVRGLISDRFVDEWPKNIWAVTAEGLALEAQLENPSLGSYHGYPLPCNDPLSSEIVKRWGVQHG